jgi:mannose-6-phosphate isomerase-like protein (cupin superfamily)
MQKWFFAYGPSTAPDRFKQEFQGVSAERPASIADHRLFFSNPSEEKGGGTSCIVPSPGDTVLGTAYLVEEEALRRIEASEEGKRLHTRTAQVEGRQQEVSVLLPETVGEYAAPSDSYLARVRDGLSYFYPTTLVDDYLRRAVDRQVLFNDFLIQRADEAVYNWEYNCHFRRLYPWKGVVRTSYWGSAVGVVEPGSATSPHNHDEEETAYVLAGEGEVTLAGKTTHLKRGDVIFFPPLGEHTIKNTSPDQNLEVLFIWWGGADGEAAQRRALA